LYTLFVDLIEYAEPNPHQVFIGFA
jgi:hypothetical protein